MGRALLLVSILAITLFVLLNLLFVSDRELVEADVERLVEIARTGGEEAVDAILDALANDYRGEGTFARARIERRLRHYIGKRRMSSIEIGAIHTVLIGEEIHVPLLRIDAQTKDGQAGSFFLRIVYGERADGWKIVEVSRGEIGRH